MWKRKIWRHDQIILYGLWVSTPRFPLSYFKYADTVSLFDGFTLIRKTQSWIVLRKRWPKVPTGHFSHLCKYPLCFPPKSRTRPTFCIKKMISEDTQITVSGRVRRPSTATLYGPDSSKLKEGFVPYFWNSFLISITPSGSRSDYSNGRKEPCRTEFHLSRQYPKT